MARSGSGISVKPNCAGSRKTCGDEAAKMKPAISKHRQKQERINGQSRDSLRQPLFCAPSLFP